MLVSSPGSYLLRITTEALAVTSIPVTRVSNVMGGRLDLKTNFLPPPPVVFSCGNRNGHQYYCITSAGSSTQDEGFLDRIDVLCFMVFVNLVGFLHTLQLP